MVKPKNTQGAGLRPNLLLLNMTPKKLIKESVKIIIEADANPITIVIRLSKRQIYKVLDVILPDTDEESSTN